VVHRAFRLLGRVLEQGMASGEFRRLDTANTVRLVIAPVIFSAIWRHSLGRYDAGAMDVRAFLAAHVDMLLRGLAPEHAPKGSPQ
jgi:TetR/AcrR family transcriptional regulator